MLPQAYSSEMSCTLKHKQPHPDPPLLSQGRELRTASDTFYASRQIPFAGVQKHHPAPAVCGSSSVTRKPPSSRLARAIRPPCASLISRASARPKPVPERLVE